MPGAGWIAGAMVLSTVISSAMAPKPPKPPDNTAFDQTANIQAKKAADTSSSSTADAIKAARKRSGMPQQDTLLTGGGIDDSDLNAGTSLLS